MIRESNIQRWKKVSIPVLLGVFVIGVIAFCVVYFQEKREQGDLALQIGQLSGLVSKPVESDAVLLARFEEVEQQIPVISDNPAEGQFTKLEFIEQVNTLIIDRVSDPALYSGIDTGPSGNFKITYDADRKERVGNTNYSVLKFNVDISGADYDQLLFFVHDVGTMESLPTLVVTRLTVIPEISPSYVDLDLDIYCITG